MNKVEEVESLVWKLFQQLEYKQKESFNMIQKLNETVYQLSAQKY